MKPYETIVDTVVKMRRVMTGSGYQI